MYRAILTLVLSAWAGAVAAQRAPVEADTQKTEPPPSQPTKWLSMDYGPFLTTSVAWKEPGKPKNALPIAAYKGIAIKLGGASNASVLFDTDLLCMTAGWTAGRTGGYLDLLGSMMPHHKGTANASVQGDELFRCAGPGWLRDGQAEKTWDAKENGPLPREWGRYTGLYLHGDHVVLSYSVGGNAILEWPRVQKLCEGESITRAFHIANTSAPLVLRLGQLGSSIESSAGAVNGTTTHAFRIARGGQPPLALALAGLPSGAEVMEQDGEWRIRLPRVDAPTTFHVAIGSGIQHNSQAIREWLSANPFQHDLKVMLNGGPRRWTQEIARQGKLGTERGPYVVDDLAVPEDNPWTSWMRTTALDFFPDGTAAVSTFNGDVWIVAGIDDALKNLTWRRFATGLYEPLGLRIVDGKVYVRGRDQVTRLHDLNNDGEADYYENFNNDGPVNPSYHGFCFELQTDSHGNFWYTRTGHRASPGLAGHGVVHRLSKDGSTDEVVATGLRAPNGLGISPTDEVAVTDNQGNWVPSSKIHLVKPDQFLGYTPQHHRQSPPGDYAPPLAWLPMTVDSSSGSPIYVTSDQWGPLKDRWLLTSFGRAALVAVLPEIIDGQEHAAVVRFPLTFGTGIMRGRFNPKDGQLYLCGVGGGWQAGGPKDGALLRVRYTGKPVTMPVGVTTEKDGIRLHFAIPLDKKSAEDDQNYALEQWNYKWTDAYGSPDFSVEDPKKKARDEVELESATLSPDARSVLLKIPDLKPVMQLGITTSIKSAAGEEIEWEIFKTIHRVPK